MAKYRRMTLAVRCQIDAFLQAGFSVNNIAKRVGFNKSSIYRELSRNSLNEKYSPVYANKLYQERRQNQGRKSIVVGALEGIVIDRLLTSWSPEQISGRLKLEKQETVSHQSIYEFISKNQTLKPSLRKPITTGPGRYLQRKIRWMNKLHISKRPDVANKRARIGDWERDTMYGKNRQQLLVCTDRKSRFTKISVIKHLNSKWINLETDRIIRSTGKAPLTITNDNGSEFRCSTNLGVKVFYCTPQSPQQRGTVENTVGLIRQYLTRKSDFSKLDEQEIKHIEDLLNHRPRKCLGYKTPYEVYYGKKVALVS